MTNLRAIIADDEPDAIEVLSALLNDTQKVEVIALISEPLKIECNINKLKPDVLFLDIKMPNLNGLDLLKNLREYNHDLKVVYVTAYDSFIKDAVKLNIFSYLLKPVNRQELYSLVDNLSQIKNALDEAQLNKIKLPVKGGYIYLKPEEILMLKADGNYTHVITVSDEEYLSSYNMGRLFSRLPGNKFFRINRNMVLNGNYIFRIDKNQSLCYARVDKKEFCLEISKAFLIQFNRIKTWY